ncbi:MAG TPA: DUF3037 domain-containing protein [Casimicrobiaceae bacterium]
MPAPSTYDYAVIRVVPRVEREEFVNVGVVVSCAAQRFLEAAVEVDPARIACLDPALDLEVLHRHLDSIVRICRGGPDAGPIGALAPQERFRWLTAPRSTIIQLSPAHTGRAHDPRALIERLLARMVRAPGAPAADEKTAGPNDGPAESRANRK